MADQTSVKRPDGTLQLGSWTVSGAATAHAALSAPDSDTSFVQTAGRCMTQGQKLRLTIGDWTTSDIPAGSKIKSLRATARCGTVTGFSRPRFVLWFAQTIVFAIFTGSVSRILHAIFSWNCPRPPPTAPSTQWVLQELEYRTRDADEREWTLASINAFVLELGREDATGVNGKISEVYVEAAFNERPVGTATGPTGTETATTRPTLTHTYTDDESDPQEAFRWLIYTDAQYGAGGFDPAIDLETDQPGTKPTVDTGWVLGEETSYPLTVDLVNDTYRAYLVVQQRWDGIGKHVSAQTFIGWTQNIPGPPAPLLTATAEDDLWRVRLNLAKGGSSPATETYNIEYSDNSGFDWYPLRDGTQVVAVGGDTAVLYDYGAPSNVARWYRAKAYRTLSSIVVGGDFSAIALATPRTKDFLLKDLDAPALNMALPVGVKGDMPARELAASVHKPLTKVGVTARSVVLRGQRYGVVSTLTLMFLESDQTSWQRVHALIEGGRTLLYQLPTGQNHYIQFTSDLVLSDWDIDFGQSDSQVPAVMYRTGTISYVEVKEPTDATSIG